VRNINRRDNCGGIEFLAYGLAYHHQQLGITIRSRSRRRRRRRRRRRIYVDEKCFGSMVVGCFGLDVILQ